MIAVETMRGKRVAVVGLGASGLASARALIAGGAEVVATDDRTAAMEEAVKAGIATADLVEADFSRFDALVLAPGVPLTHPEPHWSVRRARECGIEVIGDIELFCRERRAHAPRSPFVAITGTNGKSTTTALLGHLIASAGLPAETGGNIGTPVLALSPPAPGRHHVVECSSYQIDLAPSLDPAVGILLNLSEDHLDRHGSMTAYAAIKERLVAGAGTAIVGVDDDLSQAVADRLALSGRHVVRISARRPLDDGVFAEAGRLTAANSGAQRVIADLATAHALRGTHNAQNAAAAAAAALALGLSDSEIARGLATFPGLAHRMEVIARRGRVLFVNDSKATNADAAARALASYERIYWIAGGRPKTGGITGLAAFFPRIARAYLIGEAAAEFGRTLSGHVPADQCGDLAVAVSRAASDAARDDAPEAVVLLSPACASFDQFANFEARGDAFRRLVLALPGVHAKTGEAA